MEDKIRAAFAEIHADDELIDDTLAYLRKEAEKRRQRSKIITLHVRMRVVAVTAALIMFFFAHNLYFDAVAYISIDTNPSVELTLNRLYRVIATYAFNAEGANILRESGLRGKAYGEAAALILNALEANGYFSDNALISVTVQASGSERELALCESMQDFINERILPTRASVDVEVFPVSPDVRDNAHDHHMSPAKYLAVQELMEVDETAKIEDYADTSIPQIKQRVRECRNMHTESTDVDTEAGTQNVRGHGHYNGGRHH